ncbi:MAG TPA: hypothetical protein VM370_09665 [Candidatus Thermoplasmatota archaeon]|nr:hypothetical protein [Candidatus Thermoplasmatota archaeon]
MLNSYQKSILAALVAGIMIVAAPPGAAQPLVRVDGVAEVGTIDPWSTADGGSGGGSWGDGASSGSSDSASCVIPDPFGGSCIFEYTEHDEFDHLDEGGDAWYWYQSADSTMSGYYIDVLDGVVFVRAASGASDSASGWGYEGGWEQHDITSYANNVGYSEEHSDESSGSWDDAYSSASHVDQLLVEADTDAPVAHGGVFVDRQANGASGSSRSSEGESSSSSSDEYIGVPLSAEEAQDSHFFDEESQAFWNRTQAGGAIYLINPTDGGHVDVLGLQMDRGDAGGSGEEERASDSHQATSVFGFTMYDHSTSDAGESEYAFFSEWLHLSVDLVSGTVVGGLTYEHGDDSSSSSGDTTDDTEIVGVPIYGEEHAVADEAESSWRDVGFALDAGQGAGVLHVDSWDDSSETGHAYEDTYSIVGIPVGTTGEDDTSFHSDGLGFGLELGGGLLWLGARYENRSEASSGFDDLTLDRAALFGIGSDDSDSSRGVYAGAGSAVVPVGAQAHHENSSSHRGDWLRLDGEDFLGITQDDQHTEYGGDAHAGDVFVFSLLYEDGSSDDAIHLAGVPVGVTDDYHRLGTGVGGEVRAPTGQHIFSYSFEHEETSDDYDVYADDTTIGGARNNVTSDHLNVIVLDGMASAYVDRDFSNTQVFAGDDTEVAEVGLQNVGAGVGHGAAGPVEDGGADASIFLAYVEAADAIAIIVGLATWCVDPGVPIPYDTLLGALPGEAQPVAATALGVAALAMCFGAPVLVPLFLASPCIVVPLAFGTVFLTAGTATSLLPAGADVANMVLGTGEGAAWTAYDDTLGCVWLTIPDAARNPQPAVAALTAATEVSDLVLAQAWPAYDGARVTAWSVVDMAFGMDHGIPMPGSLPPAPPLLV